jgi:hypothetical protein
MQVFGIDLGSIDSVKCNAESIYSRVNSDKSDKKMPPPPAKPWSKEMKANFKKWMDEGFLEE